MDKVAGKIPGITNVWTKEIKVQGEGFSDPFVVEFRDKAAFDAYADNPAHKEFESVYLPARDRSTTLRTDQRPHPGSQSVSGAVGRQAEGGG
jgi:hypothetical protein